MAAGDLKLDNLLCFAIHSANHAITRAYKPLLEPLGLTYPQYLVMIVLREKDGQTVGSIGDRLFLESSTLTPLLKRLETAGLVRRERDPGDERQVRVFLTKKGKALQAELKNVPSRMLRAFGCGREDMKRLQAEISAIRDNVAKPVS